MSVHIVYCVRTEDPEGRADPFDAAAVPVLREVTGDALANGIGSDGTLSIGIDGLRSWDSLSGNGRCICAAIDVIYSRNNVQLTVTI